jgi:hypothetical protein
MCEQQAETLVRRSQPTPASEHEACSAAAPRLPAGSAPMYGSDRPATWLPIHRTAISASAQWLPARSMPPQSNAGLPPTPQPPAGQRRPDKRRAACPTVTDTHPPFGHHQRGAALTAESVSPTALQHGWQPTHPSGTNNRVSSRPHLLVVAATRSSCPALQRSSRRHRSSSVGLEDGGGQGRGVHSEAEVRSFTCTSTAPTPSPPTGLRRQPHLPLLLHAHTRCCCRARLP